MVFVNSEGNLCEGGEQRMTSKLSVGLLGVGVLLAAGSLIFGWFAFPAIIHGKISQVRVFSDVSFIVSSLGHAMENFSL